VGGRPSAYGQGTRVEDRPNFPVVLATVWVVGALAAVGTSDLTARIVVNGFDQNSSKSELLHSFALWRVALGVSAGVVAAFVVWIVLNSVGAGPSLRRALIGMIVGASIGTVIQIVVFAEQVETFQAVSARQTGEVAGIVTAVQSLLYLPLSLVGLFVSGLIIAAGRRAPLGERPGR
jgi:hypothetical protein